MYYIEHAAKNVTKRQIYHYTISMISVMLSYLRQVC